MTTKSDPKVMQKILVAHLNGPVSDDFYDREFWGAPLKSSELAGYQISITGGIQTENQSGGDSGTPAVASTPILGVHPTPTAFVIKSSIPLPPGVSIQDEISFRVENIGNQQVQYIGVLLLSDGNALPVSNGVSAWPTPIVLITPTPLNLSYPPPTSYP
jgi:hypothetical protein